MSSLSINLSSFSFQESHSVRTVIINDSVWFLANDVCDILGYSNPRKAISDHCKSKGIAKHDTPILCDVTKRDVTSKARKSQLMTYIDEPNLYRLTTKSKMPNAEKFEEWVFEEVLPTIRKTGSYSVVESSPTINAKELQALKNIIHSISNSFWHEAAFTQGMWKTVRDLTGVDTVQNVKRNQLPLLKSEFERMLNIVRAYMDLRRDTEREIVKKLFREQGNQEIVLWNIKHQHAQFLAHINDSYSGGMEKFHRILLSDLSESNQLNLV